MDLSEYSRFDAYGLAEQVRNKRVTPKELGITFFQAVEKINPKINAVIESYPERIDLLDRGGASFGQFFGVPFLMKDLGAAEQGKRQECGSRLMKGYVAKEDSFLTVRFREAGLSLLGRTAAPEFALAPSTESILNGVTRNPCALNIMSGGSSGGAAAPVASGIVPIAHASDAGGSIRIPASACGLVGLKPTRGRVTLGPDHFEILGGFNQEFVVCRT